MAMVVNERDSWAYVCMNGRFVCLLNATVFYNSAREFDSNVVINRKSQEENALSSSEIIKRNNKNVVWDLHFDPKQPFRIIRVEGQKVLNIPDPENLAKKIKNNQDSFNRVSARKIR